MGAFEFYFSFYGLLLGLSAAEVANGLANAIGSRRAIAIGRLTPLLAIFFLTDVASFWIFAWGALDLIYINQSPLYLGLIIAVTYYLAAALVFPRNIAEWPALDDHYWEHKRLVVGGIALANAAVVGSGSRSSVPRSTIRCSGLADHLGGPVIGLLISKSPRIDIALLALGTSGYLAHFVVPSSSFGDALVRWNSAAVTDVCFRPIADVRCPVHSRRMSLQFPTRLRSKLWERGWFTAAGIVAIPIPTAIAVGDLETALIAGLMMCMPIVTGFLMRHFRLKAEHQEKYPGWREY